MVQIFRVRGWFKRGLFVQKFTRDLLATSKENALERVFSEFGSKHKVRRNQIHIEEVVEVKPEEVKDPRVLALLE
jgi:large subunit ribosomal protein LX